MTIPTASHAPDRATALVDALVRSGALSSPRWIHAFASTPRHLFVPAFHKPVHDTAGFRQDLVDSSRPEEWLDGVYSDTALVTVLRQGSSGAIVSSSTAPSLTGRMLEALDVRAGHKVLEIGTGTGYNAALLAAVVGDANITTVDCEPGVTAAARRHLVDAGHSDVRVLTCDGAEPDPFHGPYDRIIATCAVPAIPPAWLFQASPGAVILAPVGAGLARLTVTGRGRANGRCLPYAAYFMSIRHGVETRPFRPPPPASSARHTEVAPGSWYDNDLRFLVSLALPNVLAAHAPGGRADTLGELALWHADGSIAELGAAGSAGGRYAVREAGPRALWAVVERTHRVWTDLGRPTRDRFGMTVTPARQWIWADVATAAHTWDLEPEPR